MAASMPLCYHGALTKQEGEEMLGKKNKDGAYLIRDSETIQGAMCLCVYKNKLVYTYRVLRSHSGNYTVQTSAGVEEKFFKTLDDLIHHFKRKDQGLTMHLRHSIKRKTALLIRQPRIEEPPSTIQESLHKLVEEYVVKTRLQPGQLQPLVDDECELYANVDDVEKTRLQLGQLQPLVDDECELYANVDDVEKTQQQLGQLQPLVDDDSGDYQNVPGPEDYVDVLPP